MKTSIIALMLLLTQTQVACTTTSVGPSFSYEGETQLSNKMVNKKFRKDQAFCREATPEDDANESRFIKCMITHDWQLEDS